MRVVAKLGNLSTHFDQQMVSGAGTVLSDIVADLSEVS